MNKNKRFKALIIITVVQLIMVHEAMLFNYVNGFEISLTGLAACFTSLAIVGGTYIYSETKRPSGFKPNREQLTEL